MKRRIVQLPRKMRGRGGRPSSPPLSLKYAIWGFLSSTVGILAIFTVTRMAGHPYLIGSFGASAVLLFGAPDAAFSQPRNLIGGQLLSAAVAVAVVACGGSGPVAIALAVGLANLLMYVTRTVHPPGGAIALLGVQGHVGASYLIDPVLVGAVILLAVALFTNNIVHHRQYPKYWW